MAEPLSPPQPIPMPAPEPGRTNAFIPYGPWEGLKTIPRYMPGLVNGLIFTVFLALLGTAGRLAVPATVQQVVGKITELPLDMAGIFTLLGVGAVISMAASGVQVLAIRRLGRGAERGLAEARMAAVRTLHRLSIDQQGAGPRGQLISRLTTDIDDISGYLSYGMVVLMLSAIQLVVVAIAMMVWSWQLGLIVGACTMVYTVLGTHIQRKITPAFQLAREKGGDMQAVLAETIMGAEVIQAYAIKERTERRVINAVEDTRVAETKGGFLSSLYSAVTIWFQTIVNILTLVAGVILVANDQVSVGTVLAFPFLVNLFTEPMVWLGESLTEAQMTLASWGRVSALIATEPAIPDPADQGDCPPLPQGPLAVELRDVEMVYPGKNHVALSVPNLTIPPGQQVAVVGETGSGKSTLSKLITRLHLPSAGQILIGGVDLTAVAEADLRAHVLMIPQDDVLMSSSLRDNLLLATPGATDEELLDGIGDLGLAQWVAQLPDGLDTPLGERGSNLSAGQRQLIGLIRAHLAAPQILVLDEATSALDPATERLVRHAMATITADRTTITIAHRLSTAAEADRILVIHAGKIVEDGSHAELANRAGGRYAQLWADWERGTE